MGNPKQKWTSEEEEALRAGINKYGSGKWKFIQKDPEFNKYLNSRSNIDLKDKWRNMSGPPGQSAREKPKTSKPKTSQDAPVTPSASVQAPASALVVRPESQADHVKDDPAKELPDLKNGSKYNEMIFEVLSAEPNGLDIGSILSYIEQRIEVPQNFRKQLGSKLRRLCQQEKLEKGENTYRMKRYSSEANTTIIRKDNLLRQPLSTTNIKVNESLEEAAKTAAFKVVEAEHKSIAASDAVKESERISKLAEQQDSVLLLALEISERCSRGEIVQVA